MTRAGFGYTMPIYYNFSHLIPMLKQIRINKTPLIEEALMLLQSKKYPLLEENEIVKYLISREYNEAIKEIENNKTDKEKREIKKILQAIYKNGNKYGKAFLEKKGLKKEYLNEERLYELVANA